MCLSHCYLKIGSWNRYSFPKTKQKRRWTWHVNIAKIFSHTFNGPFMSKNSLQLLLDYYECKHWKINDLIGIGVKEEWNKKPEKVECIDHNLFRMVNYTCSSCIKMDLSFFFLEIDSSIDPHHHFQTTRATWCSFCSISMDGKFV